MVARTPDDSADPALLEVRDLFIPAGSTLLVQGPNPALILATGNVIVDGALSVALEAFSEGRYGMAQNRVPKMLAEEEFHRDFGRAWFKRLAGANEARELLASATERILPRTLAWLAPNDGAHEALVEAGITETGPRLTDRFVEEVGDLLDLAGIDVRSVQADREDWNAERGRGPGAPDEDAIARARGDMNRELFVE